MAKVQCGICGGMVNATAKNYVFANGIHQHRKCPSKKDILSDEEKKDYRELTDAINWAFVKKNLSDKNGLNWPLITKQIKAMKDEGYSYKDQLYALKYVVERDGGYWGYGRIPKFIAAAKEHKQREEKFLAQKNEMQPLENNTSCPIKITKSKSFLDM